MKSIRLFISLILFYYGNTSLFAQQKTYTEQQLRENPYWFEMMQEPNMNYYHVKKAYDLYFETHKKEKGTGWKIFERWSYFIQNYINPDGSLQKADQIYNTWNKIKSQKGISGGYWKEVGPLNYPVNKTGQPTGKGRINAICFHPNDGNTIWVGAPSGGLWKTTDNGKNWISNTDQIPTIGVSSILVNPGNTNIMYIGTGDRDGGDALGLGVFKSIDGGENWNKSNTGMGNYTVGDMIMHPSNSSVIIAATNGGIYKTIDAGVNWVKKSTVSVNYKAVLFKPDNPSIVYATGAGRFFRSTNHGDSWTEITSGIASGTRMVVAVTPANPNYVYIFQTSGTFVGCFLSTDAGLTFNRQTPNPATNLCGYEDGDSKSQASYDLCLTADPTNASIIYAGSINLHKSIDEGKTWMKVSHWSTDVHADQHTIAFSPVNGKLYVGNDGGVYYSDDAGANWNEISSNLRIAQIYKIGQSSLTRDKVINGYQDNGTAIFDKGVFSTVYGGDGMECLFDYSDDNYVYSTYISEINRSSSGGESFNTIAQKGLNEINEEGGWVTPYFLHKTNPNTMFLGYKSVWRTNNVKFDPPTWVKISDNFGASSTNIKTMEQCDANNDILYVAKGYSFFRTDNCNASSPTWTNLSANLPVTNAQVVDILCHPTDENIVYIILNNRIYKSINKGQNWTNFSGTIPTGIYFYSIVYDKNSNEGIYLGTSTGVYFRNNTLGEWINFDLNLPKVDIRELEIYYGGTDSKIRAATYGRGLWESDLYNSGFLKPEANFEASNLSGGISEIISFKDISSNQPTSWNWAISPATVTFMNGTNAGSQHPNIRFDATGNYSVTLQVANANGTGSKTIKSYITIYNQPVTVCKPITQNIGYYGIGIFNVTLNTINHSTSDTPGDNDIDGYMDFSKTVTTILKPNTVYSLSIDAGHSNTSYVNVWIDYNNNGSFDDAGELIYTSSKMNGIRTTNFTTAAAPTLNTLLRMRVISDYSTPSSCGKLSYGQCEDYGIIFTFLPELTTNEVQKITQTSFVCGGNISSQGSSQVVSKGLIWSEKPNPTLTNNTGFVEVSGNSAIYSSTLTDLYKNRIYYIRAFAINNQGIAFGNEKTFQTSVPSLTVSKTAENINAAANSTATFNINSNVSWTITSDQTWISISKTSGSGNTSITLTAEVNLTFFPRTAIITISGTDVISKEIVITQAAGTYSLSVSKSSININATENSTASFDIISNVNWTMVSSATWLSSSTMSGAGNAKIYITAKANTTTGLRNATITISGSNVNNQVVNVIQAGATGFDEELSDYVSLFPNPVENMIYIQNIPAKTIYSIFDITGKLIFENIFNGQSINVYDLPKGIYTIQFDLKNKKLIKKFVKQ